MEIISKLGCTIRYATDRSSCGELVGRIVGERVVTNTTKEPYVLYTVKVHRLFQLLSKQFEEIDSRDPNFVVTSDGWDGIQDLPLKFQEDMRLPLSASGGDSIRSKYLTVKGVVIHYWYDGDEEFDLTEYPL